MKNVPSKIRDKMNRMKQNTKIATWNKEQEMIILKDVLPKGINVKWWTPKPDPRPMFIAKEDWSFTNSYERKYIYKKGDYIVWKMQSIKGIWVTVDKKTGNLIGAKTDKNGKIFDQEWNQINEKGNKINTNGEEIKEQVRTHSIDKDIFNETYKIVEEKWDDIKAMKIAPQPWIRIEDLSQKTMDFFEKHLNPKWINEVTERRKEKWTTYKGLFRKMTDENGKEIRQVATLESYHTITDNYMLMFNYNKKTQQFENFYPISKKEKFEQLYETKKGMGKKK